MTRAGNSCRLDVVSSDSRNSWRVNFGGNRGADVVGGHGNFGYANLSVQPLERQNKRYGLATMCVGIGMGIATIIERV